MGGKKAFLMSVDEQCPYCFSRLALGSGHIKMVQGHRRPRNLTPRERKCWDYQVGRRQVGRLKKPRPVPLRKAR